MNRRPLVAAIVVAAVFTAVQTALPLFGVPGYEAAELQAILFAFLAGHLAIAFVGRRDDGEEPLHAAARSSAVSFALLAGVCAVMLASAMVRGERDLAWSFAWFLVLPVPTILLASAWGFLVAVIASSPRKRHIAYALIVIAHFAYEIMLIWKQPVTFSFNVLLGYFPGPVYDRAVYFTDAVFSSRAQAVLLAIFLTGFSLITGRRRRDRRSANVLPLQLAALSAIGFGRARADGLRDRNGNAPGKNRKRTRR
ncbi:MAG: hypothetical protein M5R36_12695 [Deltaproteobacteria bacterium]|nr:hypothetical protein [Deltaproteobacteria bacterium]